jgi:hypothetical protein
MKLKDPTNDPVDMDKLPTIKPSMSKEGLESLLATVRQEAATAERQTMEATAAVHRARGAEALIMHMLSNYEVP